MQSAVPHILYAPLPLHNVRLDQKAYSQKAYTMAYLHIRNDLLKYGRQCRAFFFSSRIHCNPCSLTVRTSTEYTGFHLSDVKELQCIAHRWTYRHAALSATHCHCHRKRLTSSRLAWNGRSFDFAQDWHFLHPIRTLLPPFTPSHRITVTKQQRSVCFSSRRVIGCPVSYSTATQYSEGYGFFKPRSAGVP